MTVKEKFLEMLNKAGKRANEHRKFHLGQKNDYGFVSYFDGQRAVIRKMKAQIKRMK